MSLNVHGGTTGIDVVFAKSNEDVAISEVMLQADVTDRWNKFSNVTETAELRPCVWSSKFFSLNLRFLCIFAAGSFDCLRLLVRRAF